MAFTQLTTGADVFAGTADADSIAALDGADTLNGLAGDDALFANKGDDFLFGDDGNDLLVGGKGFDSLDGGIGNDGIYGNLDNDTVTAGDGDDRVFGGQGNDLLYGGDGADRVFGNVGDDLIYGGAGNDILGGGVGNDLINGDAGDDVINIVNTGADTVTGGDGADKFLYLGLPGTGVVTDFTDGVDKILLPNVETLVKTIEDLTGIDLTFASNSLIVTTLLATASSDSSGNVVFGLDALLPDTYTGTYASTVTLVGVSRLDLRADDFLFGDSFNGTTS